MPIVLSRKGGVAGTATGGQALSIGVSTGGNTAGNTTVNSGSRFVIVGSNGITASQGTALGATTVTLLGNTAGALSLGVSTGGNTAGDTTVNTGSRFVLVASGDATASQATAAGATTVTLSVGGGGQALSIGASTGGNTSGNTTVDTGSRFVLAGGNNITLSQGTAAGATTLTISAQNTSSLVGVGIISISTDGNTISISAVGGVDGGTVSMYPVQQITTQTGAIGTFATAATRTTISNHVWPMAVERFLSVNYIRIPVLLTITSATTTADWSYTAGDSLGIYTLNVSTLSLVSSFSNLQQISYASAANSTNASATWSMSYGSGAGLSSSSSLSTNNAGATGLWSSISSLKNWPLATGAISMSAGQYFAIHGWSQRQSGGNLASHNAVAFQSLYVTNLLDVGRNVASTTGGAPLLGFITYTQTDTAMPASVATADITTASNNVSWVNKVPFFFMVSQP